jgi:hypothetical protein
MTGAATEVKIMCEHVLRSGRKCRNAPVKGKKFCRLHADSSRSKWKNLLDSAKTVGSVVSVLSAMGKAVAFIAAHAPQIEALVRQLFLNRRGDKLHRVQQRISLAIAQLKGLPEDQESRMIDRGRLMEIQTIAKEVSEVEAKWEAARQ